MAFRKAFSLSPEKAVFRSRHCLRNQNGDGVSALFSLLTGLGVGSGGLYILWLTLVKGVEQTKAQGLNLIFFSLCVTSATIVNFRYRRIALKAVLIILLFGIASSIPASFLAQKIDNDLLSRMFGGFLVLAGGLGLFSKSK